MFWSIFFVIFEIQLSWDDIFSTKYSTIFGGNMLPSSTIISLPGMPFKIVGWVPRCCLKFLEGTFSGHYIPSHESRLRSETRCYHIVTWNEVVLNDNTSPEKNDNHPFWVGFISCPWAIGRVQSLKTEPIAEIFILGCVCFLWWLNSDFCVGSMGFLMVLVDGTVASNMHRINLFWQ